MNNPVLFYCRKIGDDMKKIVFHCKGCGRLLAHTDGNTEIVCPRCGGLNKLQIKTKKIEFISKDMRSRTTSSGVVFR